MRIFTFTFLIFIGSVVPSLKGVAQCTIGSGDSQSNVSTPKGSTVTAIITAENTNYWRNYYDGLYATANRTYLYYFGGSYSSSRRFNCHGYAWHMVHGGDPRWIGYCAGNTDEHIYWGDGSYVEVCNEMYPGKVSWASGDHSAITTATPGRWISKWNEWPLVEHNWDDTPFGSTNLKYYVSTNISGSTSLLCSGTRNFTARSISGASYTWSVSGTLSIVSGQGTSTVTVQRNGSSSGQAWIEVQISTPCSGGAVTSKREYFHVGLAQPNFISLLTDECPEFRYGTNNFGGFVSLYTWRHQLLPSGSLITNTNSNPDIKIMAYTAGSYYIEVKTTNACGDSPYYGITEYLSCGGSFAMKAYPNPANEILNLEFEIDAVPNNLPDEILLYSEKSADPVKSINTKQFYERQLFTEGNKIILDVKSLPRGVYYLHLVSKQQNTEKIRVILE